ncbi:MAG: ABC transporter ATP-binding protein [Ilumatobacteraceae bacterium]
MSEPSVSRGAIGVIGRSVEIAPALRSGFLTTFALAAAGAGARVAVPVMLQLAIDNGVRGGQVRVDYVVRLALVGVILVVITSSCQRAAVVRLGLRSEAALYELRVRLFSHIHRLSLADHNEEKRGALVSRVTSDIETLQQFFSWGALAFLLDGTLMVVVAAVMVAYDWMLSAVAILIAMPLAFVLRTVQKRLVSAWSETREVNAELIGAVGEMASGAETLHAYGVSSLPVRHVGSLLRKRTRKYVRASVIGAFLFPSGELFSVLCVSGVMAVAVARGPAAGLTSGAVVGFIFLTYRFLEPVAEFTEVFDQTQSAVASLRRVVGVLDTPVGPPEHPEPERIPDGPLDVVVRNVTFAYRSRTAGSEDETVLHDVNLSIPAGQLVAVVGRTGSGKTTLGRLVARFADPITGQVLVGGVDLTRAGNDDLRNRLMVVPQEPFLFDDTVLHNLRYSRPTASEEECAEALEGLGLLDWVSGLPDGLRTRVGQRGSALSAGERQLVALGRAAISAPDILVLDEATSSVDALTEVRISRALERLSRGRTTIAIAHRLSTAARADRVVVMEAGRIVEDGSHEVLLAAGGLYCAMYGAWMAATSTESGQ